MFIYLPNKIFAEFRFFIPVGRGEDTGDLNDGAREYFGQTTHRSTYYEE